MLFLGAWGFNGTVRGAQRLLFPDPQPLVERLGADFFRRLPEGPGVYLMRDGRDDVVYVGKAKNLRKRLNSYRVANPDRRPRRQLRLLRAVARIELQECASESQALAREAELLRLLKPKFNRAGTWPAPPHYLAWRRSIERIELSVTEAPAEGWQAVGPMGQGAAVLRVVLVRLLWMALHPGRGVADLPVGWVHGQLAPETAIDAGPLAGQAADSLQHLFAGRVDVFKHWITARMTEDLSRFDRLATEADLEIVNDRLGE